MRNINAYPVTQKEMVECLEAVAKEHSWPQDKSVGGMYGSLLSAAAKIIAKTDFTNPNNLNDVVFGMEETHG